MSDNDDLTEEFAELLVPFIETIAPILLRAHEAGLISPTEHAEILVIQQEMAAWLAKVDAP